VRNQIGPGGNEPRGAGRPRSGPGFGSREGAPAPGGVEARLSLERTSPIADEDQAATAPNSTVVISREQLTRRAGPPTPMPRVT